MDNLIWREDKWNHPQPNQRQDNPQTFESYQSFLDQCRVDVWQLLEIRSESLLLYDIGEETFWSVPFAWLVELEKELPLGKSLPGGGPWLIFYGHIVQSVGPRGTELFDNAFRAFKKGRVVEGD